MTQRDYIRQKLGVLELLAGLAEEASELAQAALKLRRAYDGKNVTPVSQEDAYDKLLEEIADVGLCIQMLDINQAEVCKIRREKYERWIRRLEAAAEDPERERASVNDKTGF